MRLALAATVCALAPASAFAVDYLTADQAAKLMFPEAERFDVREITLETSQMQQLDARGVRARSARWSVRVAQGGGVALGFVVVDEVIGKFELITYAVGISLDGAVKQLEVLSYRESQACLSRFEAGSDIGRFHALAAGKSLTVRCYTAEVLAAAHSLHEASDGLFDVTLRSSPGGWSCDGMRLHKLCDEVRLDLGGI